MKKFLITSALIGSFAMQSFSSQALAKTEGNYVGAHLIDLDITHRYLDNGAPNTNFEQFGESKTSFGFFYKHAFNFEGFFVAPGAFYERIDSEANLLQDGVSDAITINNRKGISLDVGYDITDKAAIYATYGIASVDYDVNWRVDRKKKSGNAKSPIIGLGVNFYPSEKIALNFEINRQEVELDTPHASDVNASDTRIDAIKFGVAYKF